MRRPEELGKDGALHHPVADASGLFSVIGTKMNKPEQENLNAGPILHRNHTHILRDMRCLCPRLR